MELKEIKSIIDLMIKNNLTEFEFEKDNVKIRIRRGPEGITQSTTALGHENGGNGTSTIPLGTSSLTSTSSAATTPPSSIKEIKSPMVGTFYRSPSPESAHYVEIGQAVNEDTVVCLIEAMKVMNEIKAGVRGVISEILVENAKPVEFGKPLFKVNTQS